MTSIVNGVATNVTNSIIALLVQQLKDVMELDDNLQLVKAELGRMEESLRHIRIQFEDQQRKLPEIVERALKRMQGYLEEAEALIHRATRQRERCRGCGLLCSPKIPAEIREWKTTFGELFQQLESSLSMAADTSRIVESAPPQPEVLLQPLPESGFVGSGIEAARKQLLSWLDEPDPHARVIGVYGMAGVGKTSLLQLIERNFKQKQVSSNFDLVIFSTVSQNYKIKSLQDTIAESVGLDVKGISSIDVRKGKLSGSLENKRFLLILDDMWSRIDLIQQVGVNFGHHNSSRVLISSRYRDVVETMAINCKYCMMIQPLSPDEGWELFRRRAFTNEAVRENNLEAIAREVASECKGLPLAINTVAAAMARKKTADEWSCSLVLMKNADPSFPSTHRTIDVELYQRLRWSYNDLPNHLQMCFLYCAAFPEDARIKVETLVEMWTAERLVPHKGTTYFMDAGRKCVDALADRCLIEYVSEGNKEYIKVHDVLRDMAIYIGEGKEIQWLFLAGQHLKTFPSEEDSKDRKRISVVDNEIRHLPADFMCPALVSLVLAKNKQLKDIPERFLVNFMSLKVLDLSYTSIQALPTSVGQLVQLEILNLGNCGKLEELPDSICNLFHLQFLNLEWCGSLNSLPDRIGELKHLKHLKFSCYGEGEERRIPCQIYQLTSLNKLVLPQRSTPMSVEDLTNLSNLIELDVRVKPEIKGGSMSTWSEMRKLRLRFECSSEDESRDDAALNIRPQNLQSMKKLQSLCLEYYLGVIPNCICQFQNLKELMLEKCRDLKELSTLESGRDAARGGFPMLESLTLWCLDRLESLVWNKGTMLKLQVLWIHSCRVLKTIRMEEPLNLREVRIEKCNELKELFIANGALSMLEGLYLRQLPRVEIASRIVWSEETMPRLKRVWIEECLLGRRLSMEKLPNLGYIQISDCRELEVVEIGNLPMLKVLHLHRLEKLESIATSSSSVRSLEVLEIRRCPLVRTLPDVEDVPNLREIRGESDWWEGIIWKDENVKIKLSQLFRVLR